MGGWYMREISIYNLQINYKNQITNLKHWKLEFALRLAQGGELVEPLDIWLLRFVICRLKTSKC
jgi:hypothetical protein